MACNENVIKNMANEVTRNLQTHNMNVDPKFVIYLIELLLLNPKYGKLFAKSIKRNNLAYFVNECVTILRHGGTPLSTLKIQFILQTNYDQLDRFIKKHLTSRQKYLRPIYDEILNEDPDPNNMAAFAKLFRKISLYIILISGLGNTACIITLKEGIAALESVFTLKDLKIFVVLPRSEKIMMLEDLIRVVSGVRLFNKNCKKGGEDIPNLTACLFETGKTCMSLMSKTLITVMQRVNILTTAIIDSIVVHDETGNVIIQRCSINKKDFSEILNLLAFNRQFEMIIRKLLFDVELMTQKSIRCIERVKAVFEELKTAVKYKTAVPVYIVFPLFCKLWDVWHEMQNVMHVVTTMNSLISILNSIQERIKMPVDVLKKIPKKRKCTVQTIRTINQSTTVRLSVDERLSLASLNNYVSYPRSSDLGGIRQSYESSEGLKIEFLGFCALCLCVGALIPSDMRVGLIKIENNYYGFCSVQMAVRFSKEPERYINEVLNYVRNNPHLINLLNVVENVYAVKDISDLVVQRFPKKKALHKNIQTETHPMQELKNQTYSSNLWEWKERACFWASIVNCQTHSTQTDYSHCRSNTQCQTVSPRHKELQTMKDSGMNTLPNNHYLWGLRGKWGDDQRVMDLSFKHPESKPHAPTVTTCTWPCIGNRPEILASDYYYPGTFYLSASHSYDPVHF